MKFSGGITIYKSDIHAKGQGRRSKVKVTEVKTNFAQILSFLDYNSSLNLQIYDYEIMHKAWSSI